MSYYNTTDINGSDLMEAVVKCNAQGEVVYLLFKNYKRMSPSDVWEKYVYLTHKTDTPLTSIRRAITCLTNENRLTQTKHSKIGRYGRKEYIWELL